MSRPIVYVAFANQQDSHLPLLKEESRRIKDALRPLEAREFIKVEIDESAGLDDMVKTLSTYPDQCCVFHYAGHAESDAILLEGGDANSKGLAKLLGEQSTLQLVFLNGCSTKAQVQQLFDAGVPAVIATSVPIEDQKAVTLAGAFYQALANKRSIKTAFEFAKATLETAFSDAPTLQITRGIKLKETPKDTSDIPWGLYLQEEQADAVLQWRLPYYREVGLPKDMIQYIGQELQLNRYIVMVLDAMVKYNKDIYHQMIEVRNGKEVKRDSSVFLDLVIQNFPWVIGSQIQLLRQKTQPNRDRLEQLMSTYIITTMVLYYILLSNFWEEHHFKKGKASKDFLKQHTQTRDQLLQTDFLRWIVELFQLLQDNQYTVYAPEYENLVNALRGDSHSAKAWQYLEQVRKQLLSDQVSNLQETCLKTEQAVALLLQEAAFLADYDMLTIRNITIDNPRFHEKTYDLGLGALNAIVDTSLSLYDDASYRRKDNYSNCKSIVLTSSEDELQTALNLSPFIIDKNTFLDKNHIDLFLYGYSEGDTHYYLAVKHSIFIALQNEKGTDIIDTNMTVEDFQEGRNIQSATTGTADDFGFGDAFGFDDPSVKTADSPKVFEVLHYQFEQFQTHFT